MPEPTVAPNPQPSAPSVPAEAYDRDYFLEHCVGFEQWSSSGGRDADGRYLGCIARARMQPGDRIIDIGTARGELLPVAVEQGAAWAIGIDYSADSVELARQTIGAHGMADRCLAIQADCQALPLASGSADLVFMLDVVEHLTPVELHNTLGEAHRVLRPGGRLFIHTFPTSTVYNVTYRLQRWLLPWRLLGWPANPRAPDARKRADLRQAAPGPGGVSAVRIDRCPAG